MHQRAPILGAAAGTIVLLGAALLTPVPVAVEASREFEDRHDHDAMSMTRSMMRRY